MTTLKDVKVNVLPVLVTLIHSEAYEGPCRIGKPEELTPQADRQRSIVSYEAFARELRQNVGPKANLLEPVTFEVQDDFVIRESELAKLEPQVYEADLVLISGGLNQGAAIMIGERYHRPIGQVGWVMSVDITAYLRTHGLEGYAFLDYAHLNNFLDLLQVRKAFRQMRMMVVTQGHSLPSSGVVSSIVDLGSLRTRYGVDHTYLSASQVTEALDNLPEAAEQEAQDLTDRLISGATACHMQPADILPSLRFFVTVKQLLEQYECNAFTIPCFEVCATKTMAARRVMFCLAHTLLKDMGIPSACEADTNVLMAIALLTYLSNKSVFMGNSWESDRKRNLLRVAHDVPGLQMKGLEAPPVPYELRNFTVAGWGATVRYDFARDRGETVTLARFNPTGDKVLVAKGQIVGAAGVNEIGCSLGVDIEVNDIVDFFDKEQDFGHHLAVVYGDYVAETKQLGRLMGFGVVES